jgi:hypothetical protein
LGKAEVVRVGRLAVADQTGKFGHALQVSFVPDASLQPQ